MLRFPTVRRVLHEYNGVMSSLLGSSRIVFGVRLVTCPAFAYHASNFHFPPPVGSLSSCNKDPIIRPPFSTSKITEQILQSAKCVKIRETLDAIDLLLSYFLFCRDHIFSHNSVLFKYQRIPCEEPNKLYFKWCNQYVKKKQVNVFCK